MQRLILVLAIVVAGCSMSGDAKLAEQAVTKFHESLDAGQFDAIYEDSAKDLKDVATKGDFAALLEAVHQKLGATKSASETGFNMNYNTSGKFVTLTYSTIYAEGEASERFVYRVHDDRALLVGYHINSNALIVK